MEPTGVDEKTVEKFNLQILVPASLLEAGLILYIWLLWKAAGLSTDVISPHKVYATKGQEM